MNGRTRTPGPTSTRIARAAARTVAGLATAALVVTGLTTGAGAAPPARQDAPRADRTVHWSPCYREMGPFECGLVPVPLDHDSPRGGSIQISMVRLPAGDPEQRIGSLFVNPGGPGGSGVDIVLFAGPFLFPQEVSDRFDLVGFDPRGIARSSGQRCLPTATKFFRTYAQPFAFPVTPEQERAQAAADRRLVQECQRGSTRVLEHMSTADVARDLDLLRAAVGDDQLTYFGVSYGSFLGATYAQLFPDRVRALALDAILDPVAFTTGRPGEEHLPVSARLGSGPSADATLAELFRLCDLAGPGQDPSAPGCALAGAGPSADRFAAATDLLLEQGPVTVVDPFTGQLVPFGYSDLVAFTLGALYDPSFWPFYALLAAGIEQQLGPQELGHRLGLLQERAGWSSKRGFPRYPGLEAFAAVGCLDGDNPDDQAAWPAAAAAGDAAGSVFTRPWVFASSPCAVWPFESDDRWTGPWDAETANPVLIIGGTHDPATPYEGALVLHSLMPGSYLVTVQGWGHVSTGFSTCSDDNLVAYLVDQAAPATTTCALDWTPFVEPAPGPQF